MELLVSMGIAAILEALKDKRSVAKILDKLAKVYVAIEREAEVTPMLRARIETARHKS